MKVSNTNISNKNRGGHISMEHKHHKPHVHALPPHERQKLINIEFDSKDLSTLKKIFGIFSKKRLTLSLAYANLYTG